MTPKLWLYYFGYSFVMKPTTNNSHSNILQMQFWNEIIVKSIALLDNNFQMIFR